jgi:ATPase subunit of ABC transporter with duplicated ATPase domains
MLVTQNLTKRFGDLLAVDNLTLTTGNEIFGLVGPKGSGKTTILSLPFSWEPDCTPRLSSSAHILFSSSSEHFFLLQQKQLPSIWMIMTSMRLQMP